MKWLKNRLKWWIAGDEMAEVERWRIRCAEYDRWLAAYPDIALVLQNLRAMAGGAGCTSNIAVNVPWIGPNDGPWDINGLRVMVNRLRGTPPNAPPNASGCDFCRNPLFAGTKCKNCGRNASPNSEGTTPNGESSTRQAPVKQADCKCPQGMYCRHRARIEGNSEGTGTNGVPTDARNVTAAEDRMLRNAARASATKVADGKLVPALGVAPPVPAQPKCECGATLLPVKYEGGYLNEDQFMADRRGDWYCAACKPWRYFWNREVAAGVTLPDGGQTV